MLTFFVSSNLNSDFSIILSLNSIHFSYPSPPPQKK